MIIIILFILPSECQGALRETQTFILSQELAWVRMPRKRDATASREKDTEE